MFQILLVTALCLDAFTASLAYGVGKTKIPPVSILVISLICTTVLAVSTGLGTAAKNIIPPAVSGVVSFVILLIIGLVKSFEYFLKRRISKKENCENQIKMKLFDLNFVLTVYADTEKADIDKSKTLSVKEALYLALALSIDGFAAGAIASQVFAFGLFVAAIFASVILPVATAFYVCEAFGYEAGIDKKWDEAPQFYWLYTGIIVLSAGMILIPNAPLIQISLWSQRINGILLPVVLICMVLIVNKKEVMGDYVNKPVSNIISWITIVVLIALTASLVISLF